jgi:glyoxylase-like metal-dependent hydrolase (beta-lactamase superfamily II)
VSAIQRVVTSGTFSLDGGTWEVDNNIWIVGNDEDVVVFDAAHTTAPIIDAVAARNVVAVVCTHGHNDHITVAPELSKRSTPRCCYTQPTKCSGGLFIRTITFKLWMRIGCSPSAASTSGPSIRPATHPVRCAGTSQI